MLRFLGIVLPDFVSGLMVTIWIAAVALPSAVLVGLLFAAGKASPIAPLRHVTSALVEFLRNTPLLLQLFFIYFGTPLIGYRVNGALCGIVAIAAQHGAFLADVLLGAIRSIPRFHIEAATALGMRRLQVLRHVILPQAILRIVAPVGNQLIIVVKDTSILSGIGVLELTLTGTVVMERTSASFEVFMVIGAAYIMLTAVVGLAFGALERCALPRIG